MSRYAVMSMFLSLAINVNAADSGGFGVPPKAATMSLEGTPYADYKKPAPRSGAAKPKVRYKNGKLVEDTTPPVILLASELGDDSSGKLVVPAYVGDISYLSAQVQTEAQSPLPGKALQVSSKRGNLVLVMADATDAEGYIDFRLLALKPGRDEITVDAAGVQARFVFDVIEAPASEWLGELDLKGITPWALLLGTPVEIGRERVIARFPAELQKLNGTTVRLAGFMLPLDSSAKQRHFLLSANPPACFFHPPGGPTSVAEVFVAKGGIEASYDAVVVEGRLELIGNSPGGIVFKLNDAKLVSRG